MPTLYLENNEKITKNILKNRRIKTTNRSDTRNIQTIYLCYHVLKA